MPTYSYMNKKTQERSEIVMSISEMEEYENNNPHMQRIYEQMNIVDPTGIGVLRPPADFQKYVLGRIKHKHPKGSVEKRWNIPKEI